MIPMDHDDSSEQDDDEKHLFEALLRLCTLDVCYSAIHMNDACFGENDACSEI